MTFKAFCSVVPSIHQIDKKEYTMNFKHSVSQLSQLGSFDVQFVAIQRGLERINEEKRIILGCKREIGRDPVLFSR